MLNESVTPVPEISGPVPTIPEPDDRMVKLPGPSPPNEFIPVPDGRMVKPPDTVPVTVMEADGCAPVPVGRIPPEAQPVTTTELEDGMPVPHGRTLKLLNIPPVGRMESADWRPVPDGKTVILFSIPPVGRIVKLLGSTPVPVGRKVKLLLDPQPDGIGEPDGRKVKLLAVNMPVPGIVEEETLELVGKMGVMVPADGGIVKVGVVEVVKEAVALFAAQT